MGGNRNLCHLIDDVVHDGDGFRIVLMLAWLPFVVYRDVKQVKIEEVLIAWLLKFEGHQASP